MNTKILPLTTKELEIVRKKYEKRYSKFKNISVIAPILGIATLITPPEIWNIVKVFDKRQGMRTLEDMNEYMFQSPTMIAIVFFMVTATIFCSYFFFIRPVKKDLKDKEKIRGHFKVIKIEHLSKRVSKNLDGLDTILHFEKNNSNIKKHLFKKIKNPELLNAKGVTIEQSKHSSIIFMESIIE